MSTTSAPIDIFGKSLNIIIPEKHRKAHWDGWDRVMESSETRYGPKPLNVPGVRADGSKMSLEFSITILKDDSGKIEGVAVFLRDVTADWDEKKTLHIRIKELERQLEGQ
nr:PAS domain-containing protein [Corynebacterium crudilactis]